MVVDCAPVLGVAIVTVVLLFTMTQRVLFSAARWVDMSDVVFVFWNWLRFPAGLALASVAIVVVLYYAPSRSHALRAVVPGAAVAAGLWIVASLAFSHAMSGVMRFGVTYGSFSAAIVLLVYLYPAAADVLFGAEQNAVLRRERSAVVTGAEASQ